MQRFSRLSVPGIALFFSSFSVTLLANDLEPLKYNHPKLTVDLGVGLWAWPLPMDYDNDGDFDLVVSCPDKPYNGTYLFENPGGTFPTFRKARRIGPGFRNVRVSHATDQARVLAVNTEYADFKMHGFSRPVSLGAPADFHEPVGDHGNKIRASQWNQIDLDSDGDLDIYVGVGDWSDYGWDDAFDANGNWTHGPLHGFVYVILNVGTDDNPSYSTPRKLETSDGAVDVYGWPSPNFADFDSDGDLDLLCGEFLDGFTYFENKGTPTDATYAAGRRLFDLQGNPLVMDLQMIVPCAIDWDRDGDIDLIVGDEDGRVALIEHSGKTTNGLPLFHAAKYFQQEADLVKCGALSTPCAVDWDADGDQDIICGNTAGYIEFFENLGVVGPTGAIQWNRPRRLQADGEVIRIQAGPHGSIQGPCEAKWGYTTLSVKDWNHDGKPDIVANSIWGKVIWFENVGSATEPRLARARPVKVRRDIQPLPKPAWNWWDPVPGELVTQWRTTPFVVDLNIDGLNDLVMLDHEGYLAYYERARHEQEGLVVEPPKRIFYDPGGSLIRLNERTAGGSGRRKLAVVDWDGDGRLDLIVNSSNADWYRNVEQATDRIVLEYQGSLANRPLSSHTTSPTTCDFNADGRLDLLLGAEDGHIYYLPSGHNR